MLTFVRYAGEDAGRFFDIAVAIHVEVYGESLFGNHPFFSEDAFRGRYAMSIRQPHFEILVARMHGEAIGYIYGYSLLPEIEWWGAVEWFEEIRASLPDGYTSEDGSRTVVIPEVMVRLPWRRMGIAFLMHDEFLSSRREERAGLRVLPHNEPAKSAYRKWGWKAVGAVRPVPEAPLYECMVKRLR